MGVSVRVCIDMKDAARDTRHRELELMHPRYDDEEAAAVLRFAKILEGWGQDALAQAKGDLRLVLTAQAGLLLEAARDSEWRTGWARLLWHSTSDAVVPLLMAVRPPTYDWEDDLR